MSAPIDPNDKLALRVFSGALECNKWSTDMYGTAYAVARAVCPEHHAVYDTRTHVAVPVETLRRVLDSHDMRCGDDADIDALHSLIPTEATDE